MNITTTIPDEAIPAWRDRVDTYNAGSGHPPVSIEQFAQINRDIETAQYVAAKADAAKTAMAADAELMEIGSQVMAASPEKKAAAIDGKRIVREL